MSDLWNQINIQDDDSGVVGEKHAPVISVTNIGENTYEVKVDVGEGKHPNEPGHFIQWVELRANDLYIGKAEFAAGITSPIATFVVNKPQGAPKLVLTAIERCNLHGLWTSKPVEI